jgi:Protein of unknown function (DUF2924)
MPASRQHEVVREIAELADMDREELLRCWREAFPGPVAKHLSRPIMIRALAWQIQADAFGALPKSVARALRSGARTGGSRSTIPSGSRFVREWNGRTHIVDVTDDGFVWEGQQFASLTAIARAITGAHWSGPRFFGLKARAGQS